MSHYLLILALIITEWAFCEAVCVRGYVEPTVCIKLLLAPYNKWHEFVQVERRAARCGVRSAVALLLRNYMFIAAPVTNRTCILCERRIITSYSRVHDALLTRAARDWYISIRPTLNFRSIYSCRNTRLYNFLWSVVLVVKQFQSISQHFNRYKRKMWL